MRVVLLSTARRPHPAWLLELMEQLGVRDRSDVALAVVTAHGSSSALPATMHLRAGLATVAIGARTQRVALAPTGSTSDPTDAGLTESLAEAMTGALTDDPDVPLDEPADDEVPDDVVGTSTTDAPLPSLLHPARVRKAVQWRANKVRLTIKRHPTIRRVSGSTKVRKATTLLTGGVSTTFALACLRSPKVGRLVAGADVVVALDAGSHRAAWLLARRHSGPHVIAGTAAAKRVIADLSSDRA